MLLERLATRRRIRRGTTPHDSRPVRLPKPSHSRHVNPQSLMEAQAQALGCSCAARLLAWTPDDRVRGGLVRGVEDGWLRWMGYIIREMTEEESERENGQRWLVVAAHIQGGGRVGGKECEPDNGAGAEIASVVSPVSGCQVSSFVAQLSLSSKCITPSSVHSAYHHRLHSVQGDTLPDDHLDSPPHLVLPPRTGPLHHPHHGLRLVFAASAALSPPVPPRPTNSDPPRSSASHPRPPIAS